jgi:hypothetical protein
VNTLAPSPVYARCRLDVRSTAGKVHNALEAAGAPDPSSETVEVRARTSVGTITIRRP